MVVKDGESFEGPGREEDVWTAAACAVDQPSPCTSVLGLGCRFLHLEWSQLWDEIFPLCREGEHEHSGAATHGGTVMEPSFCGERTSGGLMFLSRKMGHIQTSAFHL